MNKVIRKLNLCCGAKQEEWPEGFLNVDNYPPYDKKIDLSIIPWPWGSGSVDEIRFWSALEHMKNRWDSILECHRILKIGGILDLRVPHAHGIYAHSLDHTNYWTRITFNILEQSSSMNEGRVMFERMKLSIRLRHCHPTPVLDRIATRWPYFWESIGILPPAMMHWIGRKVVSKNVEPK